jgi:gluconokinase
VIVVIMGVAGCGKTLIGSQLAQALDWSFVDADDFHPAANVEKMTSGVPLTDADREPWLSALHQLLQQAYASGRDVVLACSALRSDFRARLAAGISDLHYVHLDGSRALFGRRINARRDHFFDARLLESQLATLELPEDAIVIDADASPPVIVDRIQRELRIRGSR